MRISWKWTGIWLLAGGDRVIGTFGDVVFIASADQIRTFDDFSRSTAARWALHDIYQGHPKAEYLGPGQDTVSFSMRFDVRYGMNPRSEMTKLLIMCREGRAETLIIGGLPMGVNKWYVDAITQDWTYFDGAGRLLVGMANLTLKEYV